LKDKAQNLTYRTVEKKKNHWDKNYLPYASKDTSMSVHKVINMADCNV
jgi:hypothetical protein